MKKFIFAACAVALLGVLPASASSPVSFGGVDLQAQAWSRHLDKQMAKLDACTSHSDSCVGVLIVTTNEIEIVGRMGYMGSVSSAAKYGQYGKIHPWMAGEYVSLVREKGRLADIVFPTDPRYQEASGQFLWSYVNGMTAL